MSSVALGAAPVNVRPPTVHRAGCRRAVLAAVRAAARPLTRKELARALRAEFGAGTVAKALADLTAAGELANPRDHRGYRLPG